MYVCVCVSPIQATATLPIFLTSFPLVLLSYIFWGCRFSPNCCNESPEEEIVCFSSADHCLTGTFKEQPLTTSGEGKPRKTVVEHPSMLYPRFGCSFD